MLPFRRERSQRKPEESADASMEGSTEGSATGSLVNTNAFAASNVIFMGVNEHRLTRSVPFRSRHSQIRPVPFRSVPQQLKIRPVPFRSRWNGTERNGSGPGPVPFR